MTYLEEQLTALLPPDLRAAGLHFAFEALTEETSAEHEAQRAKQRRMNQLYWSGPGKLERQIGHAYRVKPKFVGVGPPPLAIDGHAYHQRQRNRVKRRRR